MIIAISAMTSIAVSDAIRQWNFDVFLDEKKIGSHKFFVEQVEEDYRVASSANFKFKLFFFIPITYRHNSTEFWRNGCLTFLESVTVRRGKDTKVSGTRIGNTFLVSRDGETHEIGNCVRSFAYWNPFFLTHEFLLNGETGEYLPVTLAKKNTIEGLIITIKPPSGELILKYSEDGKWMALEAQVKDVGTMKYVLVE
jgi:hypothetical protein